MKKEHIMILQKKRMRLLNDVTSRRKPDLNLGIYLNAAKVAQYRLVNENSIEKEESKINRKKDRHPKVVSSKKSM